MFNSAGYSVPYSPLWTLSFALMGAIGKAAIFAIFFVFLLRDAISVVTFLAGFIDFAFAILFGLFYVHADDLAASMQAES
ncbi:MAG: hypothetical protein GYB64_02000 [Chloroflexi bacterium]|nr:hypothetical protein [Chloroflexota bacterium]